MNAILNSLRSTFASTFGSTFTTYLKGKVELVAQDDLPYLCIYGTETRQSRSGTLRDKVEYDISVEIKISVKKYLDNSAGQGTQLDTYDALIALVEDRTDGVLDADTVMGIICDNMTAGGLTLYNDSIKVRYDQYLEANKFPIAKAVVTFTAFDRPNRT